MFKKEKILSLQTIRELTDTKIIPDYIYQRRNILVKEGIITDKRVIECSTEKILIEKDYIDDKLFLKRIKRCNLVHSCPICSYRQDRMIYAKTKPYVDFLMERDGTIHLLTYTLRHHKNHRYEDLTRVLYQSVKEMNQTYPYKKYYGKNDRFFSLTKYCEDCWNPNTGFHPHAHVSIGTTSLASKEEIENEMQPKWVKTVKKHTNDWSMIPSKRNGLVLLTGLDSIGYIPNKSFNHSWTEEDDIEGWDKVEERVNEVHKKSRRPKTFRKEELEDVVVKYHQMKEEDSSEFHDSSLILRLISSLKIIYDHCKRRYLKGIMSFRIYFQVNKNHYLNKEYERKHLGIDM